MLVILKSWSIKVFQIFQTLMAVYNYQLERAKQEYPVKYIKEDHRIIE